MFVIMLVFKGGGQPKLTTAICIKQKRMRGWRATKCFRWEIWKVHCAHIRQQLQRVQIEHTVMRWQWKLSTADSQSYTMLKYNKMSTVEGESFVMPLIIIMEYAAATLKDAMEEAF
eukprot:12866621-Ditylum_brightwellii.AAC.2